MIFIISKTDGSIVNAVVINDLYDLTDNQDVNSASFNSDVMYMSARSPTEVYLSVNKSYGKSKS